MTREMRVAIPRNFLGHEPQVGEKFTVATPEGIAFSDRIVRCELHHTKLRHIRRTELLQGRWKHYRGSYWLLTLRAA